MERHHIDADTDPPVGHPSGGPGAGGVVSQDVLGVGVKQEASRSA